MIRDITLGQYYPAQSVLHRMDPRFKIIGTMVYLVSLFLHTGPYVYAVAIGFLAVIIGISKVPFRFITRGLKAIIILLLMTVSLNAIFTEGRPLFTIWKITITYEGVEKAVYMGLRLVLLIIGSSILTLTTTPNQLTDGLERVLGWLKIFRVPVHELAMMMSIALRFIPILLEETDRIMKAQMARGADFESGNIFRKIKSLMPVLVPLFVSAFRRANDLAMAMEARCYRGGKGRTKMKPLKYKGADYVGYLVMLIYIAAIVMLKIYASSMMYGNGFF